jgi:hypothetical protein
VAAERADGKKRRAQSRERRRAAAGSASPQATSERATDGNEALQAARAAATAAAVGAAVGAVRALTGGRGGEPSQDVSLEHAVAEADPAPQQDDAPEQDRAPEQDGAPEQGVRGGAEHAPPDEAPGEEIDAEQAQGASPAEAGAVVRRAREHFRDLHGVEPESVSSLERTASGWLVAFELVEVRRIPDSTDLLATFHVELDDDGGLIGFRRAGRYYRAQADTREERQ